MKKILLTKRQQVLLSTVVALSAQGFPPTIQEIVDALNLSSTNGVRKGLRLLEEKGYIKRDAKIARGIRILKY